MITTELAPGILEHKLWEPLVTGSTEYNHVHDLVRKTYGDAPDYMCENCDKQAYEFAWNHEYDPRLVTSYDPMCRSCHHKYDYDPEHYRKSADSQRGIPKHSDEFRARLSVRFHGENGMQSKLTESEVLEIREKYAGGKFSQYDLAYIYDVSQMTICRIVTRKTWNHI